MSFDLETLSIIGPGLAAGVLVLATHVPLGREVLKRGIIFIDLAVAQMAGLGVIAAGTFGLETHGVGAQVAAFAAAPQVYPQRLYYQTLTRAASGARKFLLMATNTHDVVQLDLQEKIRKDLLDVQIPPVKK